MEIRYFRKYCNVLYAFIYRCRSLCFYKGNGYDDAVVHPIKREMIYLTGVLEFLLGIGLVIPQTRHISSILIIIFFILLLPANIYAALRHVNIEKGDYSGPGLRYLWFRIPLQLIFIQWVWLFNLQK